MFFWLGYTPNGIRNERVNIRMTYIILFRYKRRCNSCNIHVVQSIIMKKSYGLLLLVFLCSCSTTNLVYLSVQQPAPVSIPQDIKTIAVVNRSEPARQNRIIDAIDKVMTLEGPNLDKEGAGASIDGLTDELRRNNRFNNIKIVPGRFTNNAAPGSFPTGLSWDVIEQICRDNNTDAVFTLELFDTDTKIDYAANTVSVTTPVGSVPAIEHLANMQTFVKTGWRIYDLQSHTIIDEYAFDKTLRYSARGINPVVAAAGLINRKEAVKEAGNNSGHAYALRLIPYWIRVYRDYYIKGSDNFTAARRKAQTGNWKGAEALWLSETTNPDQTVAGRACYNMAIISEINGDLNKAIEWAGKSYENYNNKLALAYVNTLKTRKLNDTVLQEQQRQ